jgi:arsenical pump membrane protein
MSERGPASDTPVTGSGDKAPERKRQARIIRLAPMDWIAAAFLAAGLLCVATGLLPAASAGATVRRVLPLLIFLGSVIALADLTAEAEVFDVLARRLAALGRGSFPALALLCVGLAATVTATLNLDTTAVLLTPVMLALAARIEAPPLPLAVTTVWLANTASLLLPVSNLTNLLAGNRVGLSATAFAGRMWLPELASVLVTAGSLWLFYWRPGRRGAARYRPPAALVPADRVLFLVAASACVIFLAGVLAGAAIEIMAPVATAVLVVAYLFRRRSALRNWRLLPLQLLAFVTGLFLVVDTLRERLLGPLLTSAVGAGGGAAGVIRAAGLGAGLSNVINNLPTYYAAEAAVPVANHDQLLGLLIGTNVGPLITPWASLATLIWYSRCRASQVEIPWPRLMWTGAATATAALSAAVASLLLTR